ncbi:hypothetical protein ACI8BE_007130 [Proteus mirabilis]|uniref:hypothetical protein n=1 Tax=Proteus TaxID=583 RepID=UPI0018C6AE8B|nr:MULTISPECIES: hypothetical protein [Proteus]EJD6329643.1 hypothetical protein [Proteus mirabilis]EJD6392471.1 hypothetical protein [Proteus mirabilis]MBG5998634.1 hypothetical protein [Proteus mirabilis]WCG86908.1 hypothetical protein ONR71_00115 [Proteus terrae]WIF72343.1 hypothetical protein QN092_00110 [Proteus vulgaris]
MRTFQIAGYGTTPKGLTLGICKQVISATQKDAQSQVMREAQRDGLIHIKINYVHEVK